MLQGQSLFGGGPPTQNDDSVLGLGRNLIATVPEDAFDRGPLSRSNFRFVADVRLDNRAEIVGRLGLTSGESKRMSDSALLFEALLKWGESAVDQWVGEFAFAFWDGTSRQLLLGRDILGLRPLHFYRSNRFFAFASMPSGLHALDEIPYDFDANFIAEKLAMVPQHGPRTYFKDIERVVPAHILRVTRDGVRSNQYWRPAGPDASGARDKGYAEGLRSVFDQAVHEQLRGAGDVVASHLSAGLDSSAVTATAARLHPQKKLIAFTAVPRAGFDGRMPPGTIADESELAGSTARLYPNIAHVIVENSRESPLADLERSFFYQQQPCANLSNAVWGRAINRAARDKGAKVLLKGSLGNLTTSYSGLELLPYLLGRGRLLELTGHVLRLTHNGLPLLALGSQTLGPFIAPPLWQALRRITGRSGGLLSFAAPNPSLVPELKQKSQAHSYDLSGRPRRDPYRTRLWAYSQADGGNSYKAILAEYGLSIRDPTGDKRVIEYCLAAPLEEFVRGGVPRALARRAFSDRLPPEVIGSKVRGYQSADWYEGLNRARGEVEREVDSISRCAGATEVLDVGRLRNALATWPDDGFDTFSVRDRYRLGLLRGVSAGHFMRKVRGSN